MHKPLDVMILTDNPDNEALYESLEENGLCEIHYLALSRSASLKPHDNIDVWILELEDQDQLLQAVKERKSQDAEVYAVLRYQDTDAVRLLMRAGASDVFYCPLVASELVDELKRINAVKDANESGGKLVSFINVKGGSGSTTLAVNTAVDLSKRKKKKVLLIDLDIQFGDAAVAMDLHPRTTVGEALDQIDRLDSSLLDSLVVKANSNLDILASPGRLIDLFSIKSVDLNLLLERALKHYDITIIDLPRVICSWTNDVLRWSDDIFMVLQASVSSVRDARLIGSHLHTLGLSGGALHFVQNRAAAKHAAVSTQQLMNALKSDNVLAVHNDYNAASRASDMGKPVAEVAKSSSMAKDVHVLGDIILHQFHADDKKAGFIGRLFSGFSHIGEKAS